MVTIDFAIGVDIIMTSTTIGILVVCNIINLVLFESRKYEN